MAKVRKAPVKKPAKRKIAWANMIVLIIGILVVLSMVLTGIFTLNAQPGVVSPYITPSAVPQPTSEQPTVVIPTPTP